MKLSFLGLGHSAIRFSKISRYDISFWHRINLYRLANGNVSIESLDIDLQKLPANAKNGLRWNPRITWFTSFLSSTIKWLSGNIVCNNGIPNTNLGSASVTQCHPYHRIVSSPNVPGLILFTKEVEEFESVLKNWWYTAKAA